MDPTHGETSTVEYDDLDYSSGKVIHSDEAFCEGHVDTHGKWNNGFACPLTPGVRYRCCGTGTVRHCCVVHANTDVTNSSLVLNRASLVFGITAGVCVTLLLFLIILAVLCKILRLYRKQARHAREIYRLHYPAPVSAVTSLFSNSQHSVGQTDQASAGHNTSAAICDHNAALHTQLAYTANLDTMGPSPSTTTTDLSSALNGHTTGIRPSNCNNGGYVARDSLMSDSSYAVNPSGGFTFSRPLSALYTGYMTTAGRVTTGSSPMSSLPVTVGYNRSHVEVDSSSSSSGGGSGGSSSGGGRPFPNPDNCRYLAEQILSLKPPASVVSSAEQQQLQLSAGQLLTLLKLDQQRRSWQPARLHTLTNQERDSSPATDADTLTPAASSTATLASQPLNNLNKLSNSRIISSTSTENGPVSALTSAATPDIPIASSPLPASARSDVATASGADRETSTEPDSAAVRDTTPLNNNNNYKSAQHLSQSSLQCCKPAPLKLNIPLYTLASKPEPLDDVAAMTASTKL